MTTDDPTDLAFEREWQARDWSELRSIWEDVRRKYDDQEPRFRSRGLTDQQAGWVFERLIVEAFRLEGWAIHYPYVVPTRGGDLPREQDDGLIVQGWQGFLIESKFEKEPVGIDPIFRLHLLVERRPAGTLGLFFSASDYTKPAIESAEFLQPIRVLLFQPIDLEWAFRAPDRMRRMVWNKWAFALKLGIPHQPVAQYGDGPHHLVETPTGFLGGFVDAFANDRPDDGGEPA